MFPLIRSRYSLLIDANLSCWSLFFQKVQAWCQLSNGDWALGTIVSNSEGESVISLPEGKVSFCNTLWKDLIWFYLSSFIVFHSQRLKLNTETLLPANPSILNGVDDLMQLSYLNEPSVLYNLQYRYACDMIYVSRI